MERSEALRLLETWTEREFSRDDEREWALKQMSAYLDRCEDWEFQDALERGWYRVYREACMTTRGL